MPYQINKFNGDPLVVLEDGTLDSTTSIGLVGKNFAGYGEIQNENFLWLLENFAGENPPGRPSVGQLWYNSTEDRINVWDGAAWNIVGNTTISNDDPQTPAAGDHWLDSTDNKFYVYDGTDWAFIGPETVNGYGVTRLVSDKIKESTGSTFYPIIKVTLNDTVVAIISERDFDIYSIDSIPGFTSLKKGITLSSTSSITGPLIGNADTATTLAATKNINGVAFDGSSDITLTALTPNTLSAGEHLIGTSFNGSADVTWSVNARSNNIDNSIVKRDSSGNFYASTIYSDVVGTLTGSSSIAVFGNVQGDVTGNITGNVTGNIVGNVTGNVVGNITGDLVGDTTGDHLGDVTGNVIGNVTGNITGLAGSATRLATPRQINSVSFDGTANITIFDSTKLPLTGGTITGPLSLPADPTQNLHAATKNYVDTRDNVILASAIAAIPAAFTITYGNTQYSIAGYTNQVGSWNNGANYFDVFPPVGKTMSALRAFIPSIAVIHYAGGVNGDDSMRCTWSNLGDRIRVWVQNTEQRSTPAANWLAIWS